MEVALKCDGLCALDISSCPGICSDSAVSALLSVRSSHLKELSISGWAITDDTMLLMSEKCTGLEILEIEVVSITDNGLRLLSEGLSKLQRLYVSACHMLTTAGCSHALVMPSPPHVVPFPALEVAMFSICERINASRVMMDVKMKRPSLRVAFDGDKIL